MKAILDRTWIGPITSLDAVVLFSAIACASYRILPIELMAGLMVLSALASRGVFGWIFQNRALGWLGVRCYAFYILQEIVIWTFEKPSGLVHQNQPRYEMEIFGQSLLALVLLSGVSYIAIERPAIRFGKRLVRRLNVIAPT